MAESCPRQVTTSGSVRGGTVDLEPQLSVEQRARVAVWARQLSAARRALNLAAPDLSGCVSLMLRFEQFLAQQGHVDVWMEFQQSGLRHVPISLIVTFLDTTFGAALAERRVGAKTQFKQAIRWFNLEAGHADLPRLDKRGNAAWSKFVRRMYAFVPRAPRGVAEMPDFSLLLPFVRRLVVDALAAPRTLIGDQQRFYAASIIIRVAAVIRGRGCRSIIRNSMRRLEVNNTTVLVFRYESKRSRAAQVQFDETYVEFLFPGFLSRSTDRAMWLRERIASQVWADERKRGEAIAARRLFCPASWLIWANDTADAHLNRLGKADQHNGVFINLISRRLLGDQLSDDTLNRKAKDLLRRWAESATRPALRDDEPPVPWFSEERIGKLNVCDLRAIVTSSLARRGVSSEVLQLRANWSNGRAARFSRIAREHYLDESAGSLFNLAELLFLFTD